MGFSKGYPSITLEDILKVVSEFDILRFYLNIKEIPIIINSPLRKDSTPSFSLYSKDGNKIKFHDFGTTQSGGVIDLLMLLWDKPFFEVVQQLSLDLHKIVSESNPTIYLENVKTITHSSSTKLQVKIREWRDYDLEFWEEAGISKKWLEFGKVYPISHIFIIKESTKQEILAEKYAYAYIEFKDNKQTIKVYQPFSEKYKWINKHDGSVWDLWSQLPQYHSHLIITSSKKDALCIWENTGIPSTSLQAESYLPKPQVIEELKNRFGNIFILYDNDFTSDLNYGRLYGRKLSEEYNLKQIEIPTYLGVKDTSDLAKKYGRKKVREIIFSLIYG